MMCSSAFCLLLVVVDLCVVLLQTTITVQKGAKKKRTRKRRRRREEKEEENEEENPKGKKLSTGEKRESRERKYNIQNNKLEFTKLHRRNLRSSNEDHNRGTQPTAEHMWKATLE